MTIEEKRAKKAAYMREYNARNSERINAERRNRDSEQRRETHRAWREANREKVLAYKKAERERHADKYRQWKKDWAERNKEALIEKRRKEYQENREASLARSKAYREAHQEELREKKRLHDQTPRGKEQRNERVRRHMERYPGRKAARLAVSVAVRFNRLPRIYTLTCHSCGVPAEEYHHHLGYEKEHWLNVLPLCKACHEKVDSFQGVPSAEPLKNS